MTAGQPAGMTVAQGLCQKQQHVILVKEMMGQVVGRTMSVVKTNVVLSILASHGLPSVAAVDVSRKHSWTDNTATLGM
jgi:hypothetical protein